MSITPNNYRSEIRRIIEKRVKALWVDTGNVPLTTIAWQDVPFVPPTNVAWLKVNILFGDSTELTIGQVGLNKNYGSLQLQIFVPKGQGAGAQLDALAGKARTIFSRFSGNDLYCGASRAGTDFIDGAWLGTPITTSFQVQEFITAV